MKSCGPQTRRYGALYEEMSASEEALQESFDEPPQAYREKLEVSDERLPSHHGRRAGKASGCRISEGKLIFRIISAGFSARTAARKRSGAGDHAAHPSGGPGAAPAHAGPRTGH